MISIAIAMSNAISAAAHTQLHLSELTPGTHEAARGHDAAFRLHTVVYLHDHADHHKNHDADDTDHSNEADSEEHAAHCHSYAVTGSNLPLNLSTWIKNKVGLDPDNCPLDPLYLTDHVPD